MPSIKKAVYGIIRQLSSNNVAPANSNHVSEGDELVLQNSTRTADGSRHHHQTSGEYCLPNFLVPPSTSNVIVDYQTKFLGGGGDSRNSGVYQSRKYQINLTDRSSSATGAYDSRNRYIVVGHSTTAPSTPTAEMEQSFIYRYLTGRLKKPRQPEIYYGKTGVDLPLLQIISPLDATIFASYSGPDGGLTQVPGVSKRPMANIANLDDELSLSFDGDIDKLSTSSSNCSMVSPNLLRRTMPSAHSPSQSLSDFVYSGSVDWSQMHDGAYGLSTSLYECHPFTKISAGTPIADVFGVCARQNSCILALADGVNWGEKSRLAARCAIRGAMDSLNDTLCSTEKPVRSTLDVFHCLLGAFHTGHQLIVQQSGALTTLCVAVVCQLKDSPQWVVCACNVGDSLAFVYSEKCGVREVTLGSHDIQQMRDMRDAGGALGPVDGVNPELHNLTCSMTIVDDGDIVFITSDGVSDNFDPVVGKFCVIKDHDTGKENRLSLQPAHDPNVSVGGLTSAKSPTPARRAGLPSSTSTNRFDASGRKTVSLDVNDTIDAHLPVVEAYQRHELMLLRMEDLLRNGVTVGDPTTRTARALCENLINFATQLTMAKRKILEEPELYEGETRTTQRDVRLRRRMVRQRIAEMPGKLDHATVVAYTVGTHFLFPYESDSGKDRGSVSGESTTMVEDITPQKRTTVTAVSTPLSDDTPRPSQLLVTPTAATCNGTDNSSPMSSTVWTPTVELSSLASTMTAGEDGPPPEPTERPPPLSSSPSQSSVYSLNTDTVVHSHGPFEPGCPFGGLRMIDESSYSSLSALSAETAVASEQVQPENADEYSDRLGNILGMSDDGLNGGRDDLTPARESMNGDWPVSSDGGQTDVDVRSKPETASVDAMDDNDRERDLTTIAEASSTTLEPQLDVVDSLTAAQALTTSTSDGHTTVPSSELDSSMRIPGGEEELRMSQDSWRSPPVTSLTSEVNNEVTEVPSQPDDAPAVVLSVTLECRRHQQPSVTQEISTSISIKGVIESCDLIIGGDADPAANKVASVPGNNKSETEDTFQEMTSSDLLPPGARRWPPAVNRRTTSKCVSLPIGYDEERFDLNGEADAKTARDGSHDAATTTTTATRTQRTHMSESYHLATSSTVGVNDSAVDGRRATTDQTADRSAAVGAKSTGGRFGKLSRAFDRLERAVTRRKHRRGSPNRHTVAVDSSQWAELNDKRQLTSDLGRSGKRVERRPSNTLESPSSPSRSSAVPWSPAKVFRALTSPRRPLSMTPTSTQTQTPTTPPCAVSEVKPMPEQQQRQTSAATTMATTTTTTTTTLLQNKLSCSESVGRTLPYSASYTAIAFIPSSQESDV